MKNLHVVSDKSVWEKHKHNFKLAAYLDLSNGGIVVVSEMSVDDLNAFEAEVAVVPIPHVLTGAKLPSEAVSALKPLGISADDNSMQAALKLKAFHHHFNPAAF